MKKKEQSLARIEKAEIEKAVMKALEKFSESFAHIVKNAFEYHGRRMDEVSGLQREMVQETRGMLVEFAKFKQLHRVEAELSWLNGVHGRQAMAEFKEAVGMTKWEALMKDQIKTLEAKRANPPELPNGVELAPQYTWACDACGMKGSLFQTQEEARVSRQEHVEKVHPADVEGNISIVQAQA